VKSHVKLFRDFISAFSAVNNSSQTKHHDPPPSAPARRFTQLKLAKRAKSPSAEQSVSPCSIANAARWASAMRLGISDRCLPVLKAFYFNTYRECRFPSMAGYADTVRSRYLINWPNKTLADRAMRSVPLHERS
jgi:hypothetical protein